MLNRELSPYGWFSCDLATPVVEGHSIYIPEVQCRSMKMAIEHTGKAGAFKGLTYLLAFLVVIAALCMVSVRPTHR